MSNKSFILAIDEGTTGCSALLVDEDERVVSKAYREIHQIYPQPGWVEQDPVELFQTSLLTAQEAIQKTGLSIRRVKAMGITNQRETTVVWERKTGKPVTNAIVWQCRRTAPLCAELKRRGISQIIKEKTGLKRFDALVIGDYR